MAKSLSQDIEHQLESKVVKGQYRLRINDTDHSLYLISWNISMNIKYGSQTAQFVLTNYNGEFSEGSQYEIKVGDLVEFSEFYEGDSTEFRKFYGEVAQRSYSKSAKGNILTIVCMDYIARLKYYDINFEYEADKIEVKNEILKPNFLPSPDDNLAKVFDFAHNSIAQDPLPVIFIKDKNRGIESPQVDGFEIHYQQGQLVLGSPINAKDNYDVIARYYYFYPKGIYVEDIIEKILLLPDGYGKYLFNEQTPEDVLSNHLTTTFQEVEGDVYDKLTPNLTPTTIKIRKKVVSDIIEGTDTIELEDTKGLPESGECEINGDIFTYTSKDDTHLYGIPISGEYALTSHPAGSYCIYENEYESGQVWYLTYSNIIDNLVETDFILPSGISILYFDKRFGRIILDQPIDITEEVYCTKNYLFKTLQATGVEINKINFNSREVANRYEALMKLRNYLAPNYIIRTVGDEKIWASYVYQKRTADYNLKLVKSIEKLEDEDIYTRVIMYANNKNPENIIFKDGVNFLSTGESYDGFANHVLLKYAGNNGDYRIYKVDVPGVGYIKIDNFKPVVYINGIAVNDQVQDLLGQKVKIRVKEDTEVKTGCHGISKESYTKIHTYYYYSVIFPHQNIEPSKPIRLYDAFGNLKYVLGSNDPNVDYGRGIWFVPGNEKNEIVESLSTADYSVFYSTNEINIDYDNALFYIHKSLIPEPLYSEVRADFEYWAVMVPIHDVASLIDGRADTQVQIEFYSEPPSGYNLAILDLGKIYKIQAIDITAGFYKPDPYRKYDIDFTFTLQYSLDNENYYHISDKATKIHVTGGETVSLLEDDLGKDFKARYIKIVLDNVKNIKYGSEEGIWVVSFAGINIYPDIIIKAESKLVPVAFVAETIDSTSEVITVNTTKGFDESGIAYVEEDQFTYTSKDDTHFYGVSGIDREHQVLERVLKEPLGENNLPDYAHLLSQYGDRIYKQIKIEDGLYYTQEELNHLARAYLHEFYKNHDKVNVQILYSPHLQIGQTVRLIDDKNNINDNFFIESVTDNNGNLSLVLARYPDD